MSWGERSCKYSNGKCPTQPTIEKCNVDCIYYESNGSTPDSEPRKKRRVKTGPMVFEAPYGQKPDPEAARKAKELENYIGLVCREGAGVRLRCGWDLKYRKEIVKCLRVR